MNGSIRVLCVFGSLDRGGAETMCMNLFRNIDKEKIVFDFVKHTDKLGSYEKEIKQLGGKIYVCPALSMKSFWKYIKWWNTHFQNHPEHRIVHGHMFTTSGIYFKIAHKYGRKTIAHSHCASDIDVDNRSIAEKLIRKELRNMIPRYSDVRLACSKAAGKLLFSDDDFIVLNNAIDVQAFIPDPQIRNKIRESFSIPDSKKFIAVIGSITAVKNPIGTISICKEMLSLSHDWKLIWCGKGDMTERIKEKVFQSGLNDNIIFAGIREDVNNILRSADAYLMPSIYEGLPVACIEAQAAGLPCFISDRITREVDKTGLCRFLPIDKPEIWAKEILNDHTKIEDTSELIKQAGYDIQNTSKYLEKLYLNLLHTNKESVIS